MKLYAAPRTRAVRVAWLLEELQMDYQLELVRFKPTGSSFFIQDTPTGKIPTLEDGDVVMGESGAILQYVMSSYGDGGLIPPIGSPAYPRYLQWFHFSESTAFAPIGVVVWLTVYREDAEAHPQIIADARARAESTLQQVERHLATHTYLTGDTFSAADIMMGFTLLAAMMLGLTPDMPQVAAYVERLQGRGALQTALARLGS